MTERARRVMLAVWLLLLGWPWPGEAHVVRFVVEQKRVVADGKSFGDAGPYERLDGIVYIEVDPRDPLNRGIINLDKAPRTPKGMVGFTSPFFILKPADVARGNRKIFYGVNNRGNKLDFSWRTIQPRTDPATASATNNPLNAGDFGDALLFRLGYTYVDAGWQGNVALGNDRLFPALPVATESDGRPIVGRIRVEYVDADGFTRPLEGTAAFRAYEAADLDPARSTLTVRDKIGGARVPIAADRWAFGRCQTGRASLVPNRTDICVFDGFTRDRVYELVYPARHPMVMGLGYVVTRDVASFLRYELRDEAGNPNPLASGSNGTGIRRAYGSGI